MAASPEETPEAAGGKTLVVYFTWSGNTGEMAAYIAEETGGDLLELEPAVPYSDVYEEVGELAKVERDENRRLEIANLPDSVDEYDTILIGYPIWWHTAPMIIGTFLEHYGLTGVDVYPFSQSASMDQEQFENSMDFVRLCAADATVHDGLFTDETNTDVISGCLAENGLTAEQSLSEKLLRFTLYRAHEPALRSTARAARRRPPPRRCPPGRPAPRGGRRGRSAPRGSPASRQSRPSCFRI